MTSKNQALGSLPKTVTLGLSHLGLGNHSMVGIAVPLTQGGGGGRVACRRYPNFRSSVLGCTDAELYNESLIFQNYSVFEIYKTHSPVHFWNPVPRISSQMFAEYSGSCQLQFNEICNLNSQTSLFSSKMLGNSAEIAGNARYCRKYCNVPTENFRKYRNI